MGFVAVIRNAWDGANLVRGLKKICSDVVDVSHYEQLRVAQVDSQMNVSLWLDGYELKRFDKVLFLSTPAKYADPNSPSRDELFIRDEWEPTLISALYVHRDEVINSGVVFCHSRLLLDPSYQVKSLASLGWRTPRVINKYDFRTKVSKKTRDPEPTAGTKYLLLLSTRRHFFHPFLSVKFPCSERMDELVSRTRGYMLDNNIQWGIIPLAVVNGEVHAFGFSTRIPGDLSADFVRRLLEDTLKV